MPSFVLEYAFRDLFRNKTRTALGIVGISISILLLSTVLFLTDSVSNSFVDYLTTNSGGQDLRLNVRHYANEPKGRSDYFNYTEISDIIAKNTSQISAFIPRASFTSKTNGSATHLLNITRYYSLVAMDLKQEEQLGFGWWKRNGEKYTFNEGLPVNSCIIDTNVASTFNITEGEQINLYISQLNNYVNLTVQFAFESVLKFPINEESQIVVDLTWWQDTAQAIDKQNKNFTWDSKCNYLIMLLKDSATIYDIRDIRGTEDKISALGADILLTLGIEAWNLEYPKLENLGYSEFLTIGTQIMFVFIGIIAMVISGFLINGILTTSVEERIREYGLNRVLGGRQIHNVKLIMIQGSLLAIFGTTLGIIESALIVKYIGIPYINTLIPQDIITGQVQFVVQFQSIIMIYAVGVGVSMFVSIFPALKVMRMKIVDSINPYRHEESIYHIERDSSVNFKLIMFGTVLAGNGAFVYFLIPRVFLSMNIGLIVGILIGTLLVFLMGISLLAIGLMPLMLKIFIGIFAPFFKKVMNVVRITIYRYQRRNLSTVIMFILSFSFILFTSSIIDILELQVGGMVEYNSGSDIQVFPTNYNLQTITSGIQDDLMMIEGIERTSVLLASTNDLERIFSEQDKEFGVMMGDYINFKTNNIRLYGIDRNFLDTMYSQQYMAFTEGTAKNSFDQVFWTNDTNVIISTALSNNLDLHVGDVARLTFTRGDEEEIVIANIVGVASNMPGLPRFKSGSFEASDGGVIMSNTNYVKYLNIPGGENSYVDKIWVKVKEGYSHDDVQRAIEDKIGSNHPIYVRVTSNILEDQGDMFSTVKYVFLAILIGTVLIGLFGLISSAYSSILERRREIAIIRTLGLHGNEVSSMFRLENMILLLAAGGSGSLIGFLLGALMTENMTLFTESPRVITAPWDIIVIVFGVSILVLFAGMWGMLNRLKKQNLIEIYRATL